MTILLVFCLRKLAGGICLSLFSLELWFIAFAKCYALIFQTQAEVGIRGTKMRQA